VASGGSATITTTTGADGSASITLDSEGDKSAGSTSASVTASTTADNSEGTSADLSVSFSATWDVPVAAELASFAGQVLVDRDVLLQWAVPSQSNNLGWEIFRSVDEIMYELVSPLIPGEGTTDEMRTYQYVDANPPVVEAVYYYLRQIDLDGTASRSNVLEVLLTPVQMVPITNALSQNFPNPFNPETTISFDLATQSQVTLTIYDLAGQEVRRLVQGQTMTAGTYRQAWDGRDATGARVATGVYFYELRAGEFTSQKKMTLVQ